MSLLDAAWSAQGEDPAVLEGVLRRGDEVPLDAVLPVGPFVHDAVAAASLSAALSAGVPEPRISLDPARVATAVTSERHFRIGGEPWQPWAELSDFWPTADGWARTHANYPHHRARLLEALSLPDSTNAEAFRAALAGRSADDVERRVADAGGVATAVRSEAEWREHPHAAVVDAQPLISLERVGTAAPRGPLAPRVLDLTRVIAGPVATRTLALDGADVLRVDPPVLPELELQHLDTGAGKRSVMLGADDPRFSALLAEADVVVLGYRPGALDRYGLSPEALADRVPGLIVARLSAWGSRGPFAARRGFDSIVQAATGIAALEGLEGIDGRPGALPAQALDHVAGYLLAAGIGSALRRRAAEGGSWLVETSLVRVAHELLGMPRGPRVEHPAFGATTAPWGDLVLAEPALSWPGGPRTWSTGPVPLGSSQPEWLSRAS